MIYYNYNPYLLYQLKHNILYYRDGGLIIKGKGGIKDLKKIKSKAREVYRAFENTTVGRKIAELTKADSYYIKLLRDYNKEYNNLSINDFVNSVNGKYNNVNSVKENLVGLLNHKNSRISNIAREIYNEIYAKELMAEAILLYKRGEIDEGRKILDKISGIRNTNPKYLNEFEEELSRVYTTTKSVNNIIAEENAAKELVASTKRQEAARKALETKRLNKEKRKYETEINSELNSISSDAVDFGNPESIYNFRLDHQYDDYFKGSSADLMSSYIINLLHDNYYENIIKNSNSIDLLSKYLDIYPKGRYAGEISEKLAELKKNKDEITKMREELKGLQEKYEELSKGKANPEIPELSEQLSEIKEKTGPLAAIRRHPWRTALIGTGLTIGGGTIVGGLYLLGRGVGKINQAGWELTTGSTQEPDTVDQSNVLSIENQTDTITPKISITERAIREKLAESQNAN